MCRANEKADRCSGRPSCETEGLVWLERSRLQREPAVSLKPLHADVPVPWRNVRDPHAFVIAGQEWADIPAAERRDCAIADVQVRIAYAAEHGDIERGLSLRHEQPEVAPAVRSTRKRR